MTCSFTLFLLPSIIFSSVYFIFFLGYSVNQLFPFHSFIYMVFFFFLHRIKPLSSAQRNTEFSYVCSNDHHYKDYYRNSKGREMEKETKKLKCSKKNAMRERKKRNESGICSFCVKSVNGKWLFCIMANLELHIFIEP